MNLGRWFFLVIVFGVLCAVSCKPQATTIECFTVEGDYRAAWTTGPGCFEFRFPIEGGRVEVTGDVPDDLYCIVTPETGETTLELIIQKRGDGERWSQH